MRSLCASLCMALALLPAVAAASLPPVWEVQRRALGHAKFDVPEIVSWKRKARLAALVPRVQFDFGKRLRDNIDIGIQDNVYVGASGTVIGPEEGDYSNAHTSDLTIGMRAVWEFGDAVFNARQLAVSAEARRAVKDRSLLMAEVGRHYYGVEGFAGEAALMRASRAAAKNPVIVDLKIFQRMMSCRESLAQLDALTGGWLMREAPDAGERCEERR